MAEADSLLQQSKAFNTEDPVESDGRKLCTDMKDISERWKQYFYNLLENQGSELTEVHVRGFRLDQSKKRYEFIRPEQM